LTEARVKDGTACYTPVTLNLGGRPLRRKRIVVISFGAAAIFAGTLVVSSLFGAFDDNGGDSAGGTPALDAPATARAQGAAARPEWFPATFPLPARTTVDSESRDGTGGTVRFRAPVAFVRVVQILDLNLETSTHGYKIVSRQASDADATYTIENDEFTGEVNVAPSGQDTLISVALRAK
jgi:hypothetical protein